MCDVLKLDTCGMVLGSWYLYDWKAIFYMEQNQYHLFKKGIEYVVHSHHTKANKSIFIFEQLKQAAYASKDVGVQSKEPKKEIIKVITNREICLRNPKLYVNKSCSMIS